MEYKREFRDIGFRVIFTQLAHLKGVLTFAAQPYELLMGDDLSKEASTYLVYGRVETGERLEVGFRGFSFEMSDGLHRRLGELYKKVRSEYRNTVLKKV